VKSIRVSFPLAAILLFFGACRGVAGLDDLSFSDETSPGSSSSSSGGSFCEPGAAEACDGMYSGSPGTEGVGLCDAPSRVCDSDGAAFGECMGEVVPKVEDCSTLGDENCDGRSTCDGAPTGAVAYGESANVEVCGMAVDPEGNLVFAGNFEGSLKFGDTVLVSPLGTSVFVTKLGTKGAYLWSRMVTGAKHQFCSGLAVGAQGNVFLGGYYIDGGPDFGGGPLPSSSSYDGFYAKLGAMAGEHLWSAAVVGMGDQTVRDVGIDATGFLYMVGRFQNPIAFGSVTLTPDVTNETFLAKIGSEGMPVLAKRFTASGAMLGMKIAVDRFGGGAVIAGQIIGTGTFGSTTLTGSGSDYDSFILRLDAQGEVLWATSLVGSNRQQVNSLAFDAAGGVIVAGEFETTVDFAGIQMVANSIDGFVVRLDAAGKASWARSFTGANNQVVSAVAVDGSGAVLAAGTFLGGVELMPEKTPSAGGSDAFIGKLRADTGATIWLRPLGSVANETADEVTAAATGDVIVSGSYTGDLDLGPAQAPLLSPDGDAYLVKLAP
jgi:hypothetical protein